MATAELSRTRVYDQTIGPVRAAARTAVFLIKVLPMLPSKPLNWVTPDPVVQRLSYPTNDGPATGDVYRPTTPGPHPGVLVCLGVVPFGQDHPQVPRLGEALARAGYAALLYWSPTMRDLRLDPIDSDNIALAFGALIEQPFVDEARSGLLGTCVGGSFALMAAASPRIRDRVAFVATFAPYSSMWSLARDIASQTRLVHQRREPWPVDQLTRKVYVRSLTSLLDPAEAEPLRTRLALPDGPADLDDLSPETRSIATLLTALGPDDAESALRALPGAMRQQLDDLSPLSCLDDIRAPVVVVCHDVPDTVIPISESRQLRAAFNGRRGLHYAELTMFEHMDPTKRRVPIVRVLWDLGKFSRALYPVFRTMTAPPA